jgi:hypothetical protein
VVDLWARFNELSEIYQSVQATSRLVARGSQGVVKLKASPERPRDVPRRYAAGLTTSFASRVSRS